MEPNSPKKIQFAVPLFQSQLDPQAAEHIRRRRPTPATLVIYNDPSASGADDRRMMSSQTEGQNAELSPAQRKQSVYTPPVMKGREQAGTHRACEEVRDGQHHRHSHSDTPSVEWTGATPRRKDTPYQHQHPFAPEGKLLKMPTESSFPEEEEGVNEQDSFPDEEEGLSEQEEDRNP